MPIPLSAHVATDKNELASSDAYVWLYEIEVPTTPPTRYRLAKRSEAVSFRGLTYSPAPITHSTVTEDTKADLPRITMTIANVSREVSSATESYAGLIGQPVRIMLVSIADMASGNAIIEQDFAIASANLSEAAATFDLRLFNAYRINIPGGRLSRLACRFKYRSERCGYALAEADGGLATCDKSFDGANGCQVHGDSYTSAGLAPVHPQRYGGERGIPKREQAGGL